MSHLDEEILIYVHTVAFYRRYTYEAEVDCIYFQRVYSQLETFRSDS